MKFSSKTRKPKAKSLRKSLRKSSIKARKKKITASKKARKYNQQTGQPTGREINALKRRDDLTERYIAEGADPGSARQKAVAVMRNNPRKDWRGG